MTSAAGRAVPRALGVVGRPAGLRLLAAAAATALALLGATAPATADLSEQDKADIARVEAYLNGLTTMKARFIQIDNRGRVKEGWIYIERPDKMRMEYDPPFNMLAIAYNGKLDYHDPTVPITSFINISLTPMADLVKERIRLNGSKLMVTEVERRPGSLRLTLAQKSDPNGRKVVLTFADNPLELRQWSIWTKYGEKNRITLMNAEWGVKFEPKLFWFVDPMESSE